MIVAIVVGFVLFAVGTYVADKRRHEALQAYAAEHGYRYEAADRPLATELTTRPFGEGARRRAYDVISGERAGLAFTTFRYVFETSSTDHEGNRTTDTHTWHVTRIDLPRPLPALAFTPDSMVRRALGLRDVDVESHEFNRRWRVSTHDDAFAHAVLAPTVIETMLSPVLKGCTVFIEGDALVCADEARFDISMLDPVLGMLAEFREGVPAFVFDDYAIGT